MTHPTDPSRPAAPTVREIAELTARLRDISARGRDVDPAERATFLADKDALIARISRNEPVEAAADDTAAWPPMPEWMRERARQTEAEIAAGTYVPGPVDDPARLAARLAELRAARDSCDAAATPAASETADATERAFDELCERHPLPGDGPGDWITTRTGTFWDDYGEVDDDVSDEIAAANPDIWDAPSPTGGPRLDPLSCLDSSPARVDEQERREQLTRWHVDDQAVDARTDDRADAPDDALTRLTCGGYDNQPGGTP